MATTNGTLSPAQIAQHARNAGVTNPAALALAVAVALAESGGNPRATHQNSDRHRSVDYGLWQINGYWHPQYDKGQLLDPAYNARAMAAISKNGTDWTPWATVANGRYRDKIDVAAAGVADAGLDPTGAIAKAKGAAGGWNPLEDLGDAIGGVIGGVAGDAAGKVGEVVGGVFDGWQRTAVGLVVLGLLLGGGMAILVAGLSKLTPSAFNSDSAAQTAMTVGPVLASGGTAAIPAAAAAAL